ncbi:MAG: PRC-barrel domain-containing protein [Blastocatellia bacterium]
MAEARRTSEIRMLDVAKDFKGMAVLASDTGAKLGEARDVIIHPTEGRLLGVVVRAAEGGERSLSASSFIIGQDAVMVTTTAFRRADERSNELAGGVRAIEDLIGSKVVTEDGTLLGRVSEAHIGVDQPSVAGVAGVARVVYRVAESTLQKFFGGGFFLPGAAARSYSPEEKRMIVPADTGNRYAASSLAEAI